MLSSSALELYCALQGLKDAASDCYLVFKQLYTADTDCYTVHKFLYGVLMCLALSVKLGATGSQDVTPH